MHAIGVNAQKTGGIKVTRWPSTRQIGAAATQRAKPILRLEHLFEIQTRRCFGSV